MRKLNATENRIAALALALVVLALAWLLLAQWWFVSPLQQTHQRMDRLRASQQQDAGLVAQKHVLQQRLTELSASQSRAGGFVAGTDRQAGTAALIEHVVTRTAAHGNQGPCSVNRKTPVAATTDDDVPYRKVSATISMRCNVHSLTAVLHDLQTGQPVTFIDDFSAYRDRAPHDADTVPPLDIKMTVSGYIQGSDDGDDT